MKQRFINPKNLPHSLWCAKNRTLFLPQMLIKLWQNLLDKNNLTDLAMQIAPEGFEGGSSKDDTDKHLAWRYSGSCARVILSLLDPEQKLSEVSDVYASIFAGNDVFLADLPCGSGAALVSILCTLFDLRKHNILPRQPLNITIVAGEISPSARSYLMEQLSLLRNFLEEQAIYINYEVLHWDTLDSINTTDLITKMTLASQKCKAKLLILSNFTGFLESSGKWKQAKSQFDELFRYSRASFSTAIWIEPQKKNVASFLAKPIKLIKETFRALIGSRSSESDENWYAQAESQCKHPLKDNRFRVSLTVMKFDLPLGISNES